MFDQCLIMSYFRGDYNELNKQPLMGGEKEEEDWSGGWGDDWGGSGGGRKQQQQTDEWGSWSNEQPSPNHSARTRQKASPSDDGWNSEDWNNSFDMSNSSSKKPLTSSRPAMSKNQKNELKPKRASDPVTANLIDFGGAGANSRTDKSKSHGEWDNNTDWNNEVWAEEDDDDWGSLEVNSKAKLKS